MVFDELKTTNLDGRGDELFTYNPYSAKFKDEWRAGYMMVDFLYEHFGHLKTAEEMKNATDSEGLKLYFDWLKEQGILN